MKEWPFSILVLALVLVIGTPLAFAVTPDQTAGGAESVSGTESDTDEKPPEIEEQPFKAVEYTPKGLDIRSRDGNFYAHINWRAQLRYTERNFEDPIAPNPDEREGNFNINRARFKLGGYAPRPWLTYYFEYDFVTPAVLDLRFTLEATNVLRFRVGQWKVPYNRERVDSSGKQQFAERSIVNPWFTLDRQKGGDVFGRLWEGTRADSWYHLGVFSATGRGGTGSVEQPMVLGRWQWDFLKRNLPFTQSDIGFHKQPAGSLAVAAADWQGPYTSFSTRGGGGLPGYPVGQAGTYKVRQAMIETAYRYQGFSWQQEYHWKFVDDTATGASSRLQGWYAQVGYFFHALVPKFPKPLEVALRLAEVDPNTATDFDKEKEATLVFNWFVAGHNNKLTLDVSRLHDENEAAGRRWETRIRLQWDVSF